MIKLYNTLTRKFEEFKPINPPDVGIYSCGPTVYWNQHIGHMYAYVQWDALVRFLRYSGYGVKWVMNITDVGHAVNDADTGEDKMEKGAKREGLTVWEIADKYKRQFLESMELLNISKPDEMPRATEHISRQIELIKMMEERGFTYKTKTGIVFDTSKFFGYAKFANLELDKQMAGTRVEIDPEKKNPWDFLLWVTNQPSHVMQWDSPWGKGFPGWHIECTAMSTEYLGNRFDIHTGGLEHVAVHHTNEIAQGEGAFGMQTANYWLHNAHLMFDGKKMSKSLGNVVLVSDLIEKGYDPLALRYLILNSHYRKGMNFTWEALDGAAAALKGLREKIGELSGAQEIGVYGDEFKEALENDLNAPQALAVVWDAVKNGVFVEEWDEVLGLNLTKSSKTELYITKEIQELLDEREKLRGEGKWEEADKLREKIEKMGYMLHDVKVSEG